jgi:hypothetical protein
MNQMNWVNAVVAMATLCLAGCHKSEKMPDSEQISGVSIDMPKLQQTFAGNTNDQIRRLLIDASMGLRYGDYVKSMMALEQISSQPDITEAQKKVVADVLEQEKKLAGSAAPAL